MPDAMIEIDERKANLTGLIEEYRAIVAESTPGRRKRPDRNLVAFHLIDTAEWTPDAAAALLRLVDDYGSFMLRNAAALAIALDVEDGRLNY